MRHKFSLSVSAMFVQVCLKRQQNNGPVAHDQSDLCQISRPMKMYKTQVYLNTYIITR